MMPPVFQQLKEISPVEKFPGYTGKFLHNGFSTIAFWEIQANSPIPLHHHPHAQVMHVLSGEFELTVDGKTEILTEGAIVTIPPDVPHGGRSVSECKVIDIFTPEREDYK